jgi:hypothetical protein
MVSDADPGDARGREGVPAQTLPVKHARSASGRAPPSAPGHQLYYEAADRLCRPVEWHPRKLCPRAGFIVTNLVPPGSGLWPSTIIAIARLPLPPALIGRGVTIGEPGCVLITGNRRVPPSPGERSPVSAADKVSAIELCCSGAQLRWKIVPNGTRICGMEDKWVSADRKSPLLKNRRKTPTTWILRQRDPAVALCENVHPHLRGILLHSPSLNRLDQLGRLYDQLGRLYIVSRRFSDPV